MNRGNRRYFLKGTVSALTALVINQLFFKKVEKADRVLAQSVPVDGNLPMGYPEVGGVVKDIMGHSLLLLKSVF